MDEILNVTYPNNCPKQK